VALNTGNPNLNLLCSTLPPLQGKPIVTLG